MRTTWMRRGVVSLVMAGVWVAAGAGAEAEQAGGEKSGAEVKQEPKWEGAIRAGRKELREENYVEAAKWFQRANEEAKSFAEDDARRVSGLHGLAETYEKMWRSREAEPLYLQSLLILEKTTGPESLEVMQVLVDLARLYVQAWGRRTIEPYEIVSAEPGISVGSGSSVGPGARPTASPGSSRTGTILPYSFEKAEPLYLRALAILDKFGGVKTPSYSIVLNELAVEYRRVKRYSEAEATSMRAVEAAAASPLPNPVYMAVMEQNLAEVYREQKRFDAARGWYREAITILEGEGEKALPYLASALARYGRLLKEAGRTEEAKEVEKRVKAVQGEMAKLRKKR